MGTSVAGIVVATAFVAALVRLKRRFDALPGKRKKNLLTREINAVYDWFEDRGLLERTPAFIADYHGSHPGLARLETAHAEVKAECLALLAMKGQLTDVAKLGAGLTKGGIHRAQWKALMLKSGEFIEENCALAPRTAALLRRIPGLYTAFFSVLDPKQRLSPHRGYYKGILRYHLGVVIPNDNRDSSCWLRVCKDPEDALASDDELLERGEKYYWREGEGVVFNDTYLHEAANESEGVRVVLWLDLRRRGLPFALQAFNGLVLWLVHRDPAIGKIRKKAIVRPPA